MDFGSSPLFSARLVVSGAVCWNRVAYCVRHYPSLQIPAGKERLVGQHEDTEGEP